MTIALKKGDRVKLKPNEIHILDNQVLPTGRRGTAKSTLEYWGEEV